MDHQSADGPGASHARPVTQTPATITKQVPSQDIAAGTSTVWTDTTGGIRVTRKATFKPSGFGQCPGALRDVDQHIATWRVEWQSRHGVGEDLFCDLHLPAVCRPPEKARKRGAA